MKQGLVVCFFLFALFLLSPTPTQAFYACGGSPCNGSYPCNGGLTCNGSSVCGTYYNTCSGATCNATGGWDQASCNTPNQCTPSGTTRTASWSYSACSTNCGNNTRTGTCNCASQNNCSVGCTSPAGSCSGTYSDSSCACIECQTCATKCGQAKNCGGNCASTDIGNYNTCSTALTCGNGTKTDPCGNVAACCTSQNPQTAPGSVAASQINDGNGVPIRKASISWTFPSVTSGCGNDWGNNCAGNSNDFILKYDGGVTTETESAASGTINHTSGLLAWGAHTVIVCARNGFGEKCAAVVPFTLTAPPCSVSGQTSSSVCRNTDPPLSASFGNNADQIEFLVKNNSSTLSPAYAAQSGWLSPNPASYTPSLATSTYYWNVHSQSTTVPVACVTPATLPTGIQVNIDKTAPNTPVGSFTTLTPDGSCPNKYSVTYQWSASTDTGCAGLAPLPYTADIATDLGYTSIIDATNAANLQLTTAQSYFGNTVLYGRVQAKDSLNNTAGWSSGASTPFTIPLPSPYPTIHIQGNYIEDTGVCSNMTIDPNNLSLALSIAPATGTTSVCTKGVSSYGCDITIDNQSGVCTVAGHDVTLVASYAGYDAVEWRVGNVCAGAANPSISINASSPPASPIDANVYFDYGTTQSWFKTSGTSFTSKTARNNIIPNAPTAFDTDDSVAPPNNTYLTINEGGAVLYTDIGKKIELGPNAVNGFSAHNWYSNTYNATPIFTPIKFTDYMKSRKKYNTITDVADISADGIYYVSGNLSISNMVPFNNRKVVIVADSGTVTIATDMIPTSSSIAIIANAIGINSAVTEVDAILIGNTVDIGASATKLKINGNLIQLTNTTPFTNSRVTASAQSPSLFIKFNQAAYLDLLPYLSISMYDWRQIQ